MQTVSSSQENAFCFYGSQANFVRFSNITVVVTLQEKQRNKERFCNFLYTEVFATVGQTTRVGELKKGI